MTGASGPLDGARRRLARVTAWLALLSPLSAAPDAHAQWIALDRGDHLTKGTLQTGVALGGSEIGDGVVTSGELYLQSAWKGYGGYLGVSWASLDGATGAAADAFAGAGVGNVELGAIWDTPFPLANITLRLGTAIPTVFSEARQNTLTFGSWSRGPDPVAGQQAQVPLRVTGSFRMPAGILHARGDVGFDLLFPIGEDKEAADFETRLRFGAGIGLLWKGFGGTIEYAVSASVVESKVDFEDKTLRHVLAFGLRYAAGPIDCVLGGTLPVNDDWNIGTITLTIGSRWRLDDPNGDVAPVPTKDLH
ncbi:MAG: hypothetical protein IV100_23500 [Myxococcales bacterium]|nr:hypothetical protein [Myxococcales bacterium]